MNALVTSVNFAPDHAGIAVYSTDLPIYLAERGHQVTMVTGFSYYPRWKKRPEDIGKLFAVEIHQSVRVLRGYLYVPRCVTTLRRLLHEASFCLFAALNILRVKRPDVVIVFCPPLSLSLLTLVAAKIWRRPLIINVQDLPLDAAMALGMLKVSLLSRIISNLEGFIYRHADQVTTISNSMMENLLAKGTRSDQIKYVPNWVNLAEYTKIIKKGEFLCGQPQAKGKISVAYAGNIGIKQGVDVLIHLANAMKADNRIHFFVIGDGADKLRLSNMANALGLTNLTFLPFLEPAEYLRMLEDVTIIFIAQRRGAGNNFFPSKLLGLMARQKPLLVAADPDSELAKEISRGGFGLVSPYDDLKALQENLQRYTSGEVSMTETGRKGLAVAMTFERVDVLGAWEMEIMKLIKSRENIYR